MASDKEDFVYFISGDEEIGAPPLLKPSFNSTSDSENEVENEKDDGEPASAVNPETGEINWDCPCLKSALEPPCGHTFKAAFSCFVSSKTEPKGMDCQELFKAMQECFQAHPEKYGSILADDEDDVPGETTAINEPSDRSSLNEKINTIKVQSFNYKGPQKIGMIRSRKSRSRQEFSSEPSNEGSLESSQEIEQNSNESLSKSKSRLSKSSSNEKTDLSAPSSRWKNFWVRLVAGLVMMSIFTVIILMGHMVVVLLTLLTQIVVFKEVISIAHLQSKERHLKWFRTIAWYFLFATSYFLYGESLLYYCKETLLVDALFYPLAQHHRFISFSIYTIGIVAFVLNLRKGHYKFQFSQLAFTHMILLFVVFQANFIACSIFEGLFWFVFPISLVICNDIMAYFFGFFFGRTPLIKLSPKKTWEGFWGALFSTIIFGFFFSGFLASIPYLICPVKDLAQNYFNFIPCDKVNPVFISRPYNLGPALSSLSYHILRIRHKTVNIYPIQLHSILFSIFASVIGPFGGFFASGFKRAFKVKDFSDSIPGHGGVTDRVDCQFLMGLFSYVYFISFIKDVQTSVGQILQLAINGLNSDDQIQLFQSLKTYLEGYAVLEYGDPGQKN